MDSKRFTVILIAENTAFDSTDTFHAHVVAKSAKEAVTLGRKQALRDFGLTNGDIDEDELTPLAVFEGHLEDIFDPKTYDKEEIFL